MHAKLQPFYLITLTALVAAATGPLATAAESQYRRAATAQSDAEEFAAEACPPALAALASTMSVAEFQELLEIKRQRDLHLQHQSAMAKAIADVQGTIHQDNERIKSEKAEKPAPLRALMNRAATYLARFKSEAKKSTVDYGKLGFYRVATKSPKIAIGNPLKNLEYHLDAINAAEREGVSVLAFPEMSLTGYTAEDLFKNQALLDASKAALKKLMTETKDLDITIVVGAPYPFRNGIYNTAFVIHKGQILGAVPKSYLPNSNEFYDKRFFASGVGVDAAVNDGLLGHFRLATNQLFTLGEMVLAVEICEDMWTDSPPSVQHRRAGANVIVNISASPEQTGKSQRREGIVKHLASALNVIYLYVSSGPFESTKDVVYGAHNIIAENGNTLKSQSVLTAQSGSPNSKLPAHATNLEDSKLVIQDVDVQRILNARRNNMSNIDARAATAYHENIISEKVPELYDLKREVDPTPFVPHGSAGAKASAARETIKLQAMGLARRLLSAKAQTMVVGVSGGLDSTLALLVCAETAKILNWNPKRIVGITMPGFGTTKNTETLAMDLMNGLGITLLPVTTIDATVKSHFNDIGYAPDLQDRDKLSVVFENGQARYRSMVLFDLANSGLNGINVGTGDLSEIWLGWSTYNGDQNSNYHVNASVPKTQVRFLVEEYLKGAKNQLVRDTLAAILKNVVSPELLPPSKDGQITQSTEDINGPYVVHDFWLWHFMLDGYGPKKLLAMAKIAFKGRYTDAQLRRWLKDKFFTRGFMSQFKRDTFPAGPKVGPVSLSPRGDLRLASETDISGLLEELNEI